MFSAHDFQFLKQLSQAGTQEGIFRYCEPSDGPGVLKQKLEELFDFVVCRYMNSLIITNFKGDQKQKTKLVLNERLS